VGHRRAPETDTDLDEIWFYVAIQSGSPDVADRVIDGITSRFSLLAAYPGIGRKRDLELRPGLELRGR
jgi:plasmid stabilization system protein ParE